MKRLSSNGNMNTWELLTNESTTKKSINRLYLSSPPTSLKRYRSSNRRLKLHWIWFRGRAEEQRIDCRGLHHPIIVWICWWDFSQISWQNIWRFLKKPYLCSVFPKGDCIKETWRAFSSAGSEHLPYKQRVGGSNPSTPTIRKRCINNASLFLCLLACVRKHLYEIGSADIPGWS